MGNLQIIFDILYNIGQTNPNIDLKILNDFCDIMFNTVDYKTVWKVGAPAYIIDRGYANQCTDLIDYIINHNIAYMPSICHIAVILGILANIKNDHINTKNTVQIFLYDNDIKKFDNLITDEMINTFRTYNFIK